MTSFYSKETKNINEKTKNRAPYAPAIPFLAGISGKNYGSKGYITPMFTTASQDMEAA